MAAKEETTNIESVKNTPPKISNTQYVISLVVGDVLVFLVFSAFGRGNHGEATGLTAIPQIVLTAAPFAIAWFVVAPFVGVYRRDLIANPRKMAMRTVLAWVLAWPVAMILRGIFVDRGIPAFAFAMVVLFFNAVILLIWRWPYALNNSIKKMR